MSEKDVFEVAHQGALSLLRGAFPEFKVYEEYPRGRRADIKGPAIFNEIVDLSPADDQEVTGALWMTATWQTRVLLETRSKVRRSIWGVVARIATELHERTFGLGENEARPTVVRSSGDDGMDPGREGYELWVIEWTQDFLVRRSDYEMEPDFIPKEVRFGHFDEKDPTRTNYRKVVTDDVE